jgi:hypothetical protein
VTDTEKFYEEIARDAKAINDDAYNGDDRAIAVIKIHRMHVARPNDPGALGLCMAAYAEWSKHRPAIEPSR